MSSAVITNVKPRRNKRVRRTIRNTIQTGAVVLVSMYIFNAGINFGKK